MLGATPPVRRDRVPATRPDLVRDFGELLLRLPILGRYTYEADARDVPAERPRNVLGDVRGSLEADARDVPAEGSRRILGGVRGSLECALVLSCPNPWSPSTSNSGLDSGAKGAAEFGDFRTGDR